MESIQTDGFFKDFYLNVQKNCSDEQIKNFSNLKGDEERFNVVSNFDYNQEVLNSKWTCPKKDSTIGMELKKKGNLAFQNSNWSLALDMYNEAQRLTPNENDADMSIIFANRSATLYHMKEYNLALIEIELAIPHYPIEMLYKLKERLARCYLATEKLKTDLALAAFKETICCLDKSNVPFEKRAKMEKDAQIMIKMLSNNKNVNRPKKMELNKHFEHLKLVKNELSKSVSFDYNECEGRFAIATNDINIGTKILEQNPHCVMLLQKYSKTHCQHCFQRTIAPLACVSCTNVVFCSKECRDIALATYHKYECKILHLLWRSGSSINCHMALRIISQKSVKYFENMRDELKGELIFEKTSKLPPSDYRTIYNLVRHENQRTSTSFLQYSIMAYFLTNCLQLSGYFEEQNSFNFIGSLILRNLQFLQFNTHEISELQPSTINDKFTKTAFIGGGLYPTLALFNHSCNPSIVRYYKGTSIYVYTISNIRKGGAIAENYGPIYSQNALQERKKTLKDVYWFDCNCQPCSEKWPLYDEMNNTEIRLKCEEITCNNTLIVPLDCSGFMLQCNKCEKFTNILKGLKAVQDTDAIIKTAKSLYDERQYLKAARKYLELLKIMDSAMNPPFRDYCNCQQSFKDCLLRLGNENTFCL